MLSIDYYKRKYIGRQVGMLTITDVCMNNDKIICLCDCACGNIGARIKIAAIYNKMQGCGCRKKKREAIKNFIGRTFGRLEVLSFEYKKSGAQYFLCKCSCGKSKITAHFSLLSGHVKSCGCLASDKAIENLKAINDIRAREIAEEDGNIRAFKACWKSFQGQAKTRTIENSLSYTEWKDIVGSQCYYCGRLEKRNPCKAYFNRYKTHRINKLQDYEIFINGIDRLDSNDSYNLNNCVACCPQCNMAKLDYTIEEFLHMCKLVYFKHCAEPAETSNKWSVAESTDMFYKDKGEK